MYRLLPDLSVIEASTRSVAAVEAERGVSFATEDGLRFRHRDALFPLFERATAARHHATLAPLLDVAGIVHSACRTMHDAAHDTRLVDAGVVGVG